MPLDSSVAMTARGPKSWPQIPSVGAPQTGDMIGDPPHTGNPPGFLELPTGFTTSSAFTTVACGQTTVTTISHTGHRVTAGHISRQKQVSLSVFAMTKPLRVDGAHSHGWLVVNKGCLIINLISHPFPIKCSCPKVCYFNQGFQKEFHIFKKVWSV